MSIVDDFLDLEFLDDSEAADFANYCHVISVCEPLRTDELTKIHDDLAFVTVNRKTNQKSSIHPRLYRVERDSVLVFRKAEACEKLLDVADVSKFMISEGIEFSESINPDSFANMLLFLANQNITFVAPKTSLIDDDSANSLLFEDLQEAAFRSSTVLEFDALELLKEERSERIRKIYSRVCYTIGDSDLESTKIREELLVDYDKYDGSD